MLISRLYKTLYFSFSHTAYNKIEHVKQILERENKKATSSNDWLFQDCLDTLAKL